MAKKLTRNKHDDYDDDGYDNYSYHDDLRQRRKMKRMKNALRTKNIDDLLSIDDSYD